MCALVCIFRTVVPFWCNPVEKCEIGLGQHVQWECLKAHLISENDWTKQHGG
jgi:hypothetical protein